MRFLSVQQKSDVNSVKNLGKYFSVEIKIRLFGRVVYHLVFPPNSNVEDE